MDELIKNLDEALEPRGPVPEPEFTEDEYKYALERVGAPVSSPPVDHTYDPFPVSETPATVRELTYHRDGFDLNRALRVFSDDKVGPGSAHHCYHIEITGLHSINGGPVAYVQFQRGPRAEPDSTPGATEGAVLAIVLDRLLSFQNGPYPSDWNADAITYLTSAMDCLKARAQERAERGVLGTYQK